MMIQARVQSAASEPHFPSFPLVPPIACDHPNSDVFPRSAQTYSFVNLLWLCNC
jgi:hypothetical protein